MVIATTRFILKRSGALRSHWEEATMTTANQCEAYAAEYQARGTAPDISIQRATALMSISQSWTTLAGQLDRLAQIIKDEDEEGGLDQPN